MERPAQGSRARLRLRRGGHRPLRARGALAHRLLPGAQPVVVGDLWRPLHPAFHPALRGLGRVAHPADDLDGGDTAHPRPLLRVAALRARPRQPAPGHALRVQPVRRRRGHLPRRLHLPAPHRREPHEPRGGQLRPVAGRGHPRRASAGPCSQGGRAITRRVGRGCSRRARPGGWPRPPADLAARPARGPLLVRGFRRHGRGPGEDLDR